MNTRSPEPRDIPALLDRVRRSDEPVQRRAALAFYQGRALVGRLSYGELVARVDRVAAHLARELGVQRGDRIAILSPNSLDVPILVLALLRIGAPIVPLNPTSDREDWAYVLDHCGARGLFAAPELLAEARAACPALDFALPIHQVWSGEGATPIGDEESLAGEPAVILYTSGTTGRPKGVALSHANIIANARSLVANFRLAATTQLAVLPLYHAHAFGFGLMTSLLSGGQLVFTDRFDPFAFAEIVRRESVEVTSVVPGLLRLLREVGLRCEKVPTLRCVLVSSAPLTTAEARAFEQRTGVPVVQGWGLSEYTNFACCLSPDDEPEVRRQLLVGWEVPSIGPALAGVDVTVRDDGGHELPEGTRGELWLRGPSRMLGYFRDPEATALAFAGPYLCTGDEGFFVQHRARRVFFITGRMKEIIIRGGEKVSPLAVERRLAAAVPEIEGSICVLGFPHEVHGEEVGAYLAIEELPGELHARLSHAVEALPADLRPKALLFGASAIPRTHTGKVQRRRLVGLFGGLRSCRGAIQIRRAQ